MKKAQGLPVNIVVMTIIGIIIFALGLSLFSDIFDASEDEIENLRDKIEVDIDKLQCNNNEWVCAPSYEMKSGKSKSFTLYVSNFNKDSQDFKVNISLDEIDAANNLYGITKSCGSVIVYYPSSIELNIQGGYSGSFPFQVIASRVQDLPCNFVTTVQLLDSSGNPIEGDSKASIIIKVE